MDWLTDDWLLDCLLHWSTDLDALACRSEAEREAVARTLASCPLLGAAVNVGQAAAGVGDSNGSRQSLVHAHSSVLEAQVRPHTNV